MKKLILLLVLTWLAIFSIANPVYMPEIYLGKFSFDENENWEIVLAVSYYPDSVLISSSTGSSFCRMNSQHDSYMVITIDSLYSGVWINPEGDSISITSYFTNWENISDSLFETVVFGNYRNSVIPAPPFGQSIIRILPTVYGTNYHCICDSLGSVIGNLHGRVFDKNNNLVTAGSFNINPYPFYISCEEGGYGTQGVDINADGSFSTDLYSLNYRIDSIGVCTKQSFDNCNYYKITNRIDIETFDFTMLPGLSVEQDIHLLDDFVDIPQSQANPVDVFSLFPNPVHQGNLNYEIMLPVKSANGVMKLFSASGQEIMNYPIPENRGTLVVPSEIPDGIYILQLWMNNSVCASRQIVVSWR